VCDAYDAMTSDRPYRKALPREAALEEIRNNSGTQFDPQLVDVFLAVLSQTEPAEPQPSSARTTAGTRHHASLGDLAEPPAAPEAPGTR